MSVTLGRAMLLPCTLPAACPNHMAASQCADCCRGKDMMQDPDGAAMECTNPVLMLS